MSVETEYKKLFEAGFRAGQQALADGVTELPIEYFYESFVEQHGLPKERTKMKHKHYDCIVAWAEGKKVEYFAYGVWDDWVETVGWHEAYEYRIKKEPVIEVKYFYKSSEGHYMLKESNAKWDLKITYQDGKAIKAEVAE